MSTDRPARAQLLTGPWHRDVLGDGYECRVIELGTDPDGETDIAATLVRHTAAPSCPRFAVLYIHGYSDYFFQRHLAEFFAARGAAFYALDLRKSGRSRRNGQLPHYVTDLRFYDAELCEAAACITEEAGVPIVVVTHSTGGLVVSLWLNRVGSRPAGAGGAIAGVVFNSPWFDLPGPAWYRSIGTQYIHLAGKLRPHALAPQIKSDGYGTGLHVSGHGEWDYNLEWKPLAGFPARFGWLSAIRRGQATLHRGLNIGVPALVLRSTRTRYARRWRPEVDVADAVLDVAQIQRWSGCLGDRTDIVPIPDARHDVFLSIEPARARAFDELTRWLNRLEELDNGNSVRTS